MDSLGNANSSSSTTLSSYAGSTSSKTQLSAMASLQRLTPIRSSSSSTSLPRLSSFLNNNTHNSTTSLSTMVTSDGHASKKSRPNSPTLAHTQQTQHLPQPSTPSAFHSRDSTQRGMFTITSPHETPLSTPAQSPVLRPQQHTSYFEPVSNNNNSSNNNSSVHLPSIKSMITNITEFDEQLRLRNISNNPDERAKDILNKSMSHDNLPLMSNGLPSALQSPSAVSPVRPFSVKRGSGSGTEILTIESLMNKNDSN
ncbi:unnamed protein product [Ambrosiozyma monospora]|uniref:Unnamed protein product n=1 Tax=Ambrosiozyma monospora TaxID=43982 RepID=A0ACB5U4L9_AMBMO|nr:unnamed protein product [Ambrosiozyma monospora]